MATRVNFAPRFLKDLDRLERKYPQVVDEVEALIERLKTGEHPGNKISGVGYNVYKVRLSNPSAGQGKRGGFRVIYYIRREDSLLLLTLYPKNQRKDIPAEQIRRIIEESGE
jgi:mRNA-degrading endonuclease RelE of RelBE toxin-antitoxin system